MDLHYWLGKDSSQDEKGAAAALSAHLDEALDDLPIQHREVEGRESSKFSAYFPNGIQYLWGGVASGFNHIESDDKTRLLHVKGKRKIVATEVAVSWDSFNHGDIFILEHKDQVYQWNGNESNPFERVKACRLANKIAADEKQGKARVRIVEDCESDDTVPSGMVDALGERPSEISAAVCDTLTPIEVHRKQAKMYHVTSDSGSLSVSDVGQAPFGQEQLLTGDCFLIDAAAANKVFVWKGKEAAPEERKAAIDNAEQFIQQNGYPGEISIEILPEGGESTYFKEYFSNWAHVEESPGLKHFNLRPPRLFAVSDEGGALRCDEILGSLEQTDLMPMEVCILDCFDKVYVWVGNGASDAEKDAAPKHAQSFVENDPRGRTEAEVIMEVQDSESNDFKSYFPDWDEACFTDPHQVLLDMAEQMRVLTARY